MPTGYTLEEIRSKDAEIARLNEERRRDALDGQAALDEANNEITRLKAEVEALRSMITVYNLGGHTDIERVAKDMASLRARLAAAEQREKRLLAIIDEYSRKLIRVEGGDSVAKEVSHFEEAITVLQGSLKEAVAIINQRDREAIGNRKELAAAENELDQLRKVVWHLERDSQRGAWVLEYYKCQKDLYGLDIAKMQKEMGK